MASSKERSCLQCKNLPKSDTNTKNNKTIIE